MRDVVKIETATEPRFQELFVAAMAFPHATAANPHLAGVVDLRAAAGTADHVGGGAVSDTGTGRRGGGREGRRAARVHAVVEREPFLTRTLKPVELVSAEGLEILEHNADTILEEVGVEVRDYPTALERFAAAGADVDGTRVRFPRGLCRSVIQASAPAEYVQHARNPANSVQVGGDATVFAPNYGSPFAHDLDSGRRYATIADFENFVKLAYLHPHLHHSGGTVCEPVDIPVSKRHLAMVYAHLRYSDKAFMGSVTAGERAADSVELARIGFGGDLADRTVMTSLINADVAARVGRARCSPPPRSTRRRTRRRSSPRSSSPGRWRRRRRRGWRRRRSPRRSPGWRSSSSSGRARRWCSARSPARCRCRPARRRSALPSRRSCSTPWPPSPAGSASRSAPAAR